MNTRLYFRLLFGLLFLFYFKGFSNYLDNEEFIPLNDLCTDAIELTVGAVCNYTLGDNLDATDSSVLQGEPNCADPFATGVTLDVWFSFIVPNSGSVIIETNSIDGGMTDGVMTVYSGVCGNLIEIDCIDDSISEDSNHNFKFPIKILNNYNPEDVIYIRFWSYNDTLQGEFNICVSENPELDSDGDGVLDNQEILDETNPNDFCDFILANQTIEPSQEWLDADCDGDGVSNWYEINPPDGEYPTDPTDPCDFNFSDQDITIVSGDYLEADCDGDGVNNGDELNPPDGENPTDPYDSCDFNFSDQDITIVSGDYLEADCDGDGVISGDELNPPDGGNPTDPNDPCDFNPLSITVFQSYSFLLGDCDNDGLSNEIELGSDPLNPVDTDGDNYIDMLDLDSDNDGIVDEIEFGDVSGGDTDGDNLPNYLDLDSDNDGIPDNVEAQVTIDYIEPVGLDSDSDGIDDAYDNETNSNWIFPIDVDGDNISDYLDEDSDNDSVLDSVEGYDFNHDGVPETTPIEIDSDNDGFDDAFDVDLFGFGDVNGNFDLPIIDMPDNDSDGVINDVDFRDADDDNDGVPTSIEAVIVFHSLVEEYLDTDNDGIPNYLDEDDDGDGVLTIDEDYDGDGNPLNDDLNNNGIPDYLDEDVALSILNNYLLAFEFYPNPVNKSLTIKLVELSNNTTFRIYDLQGKVVYKKQEILNQQIEINIANFSSGVYFIKLESDNSTVIKKFVKK